jgi:hypothetical protein
MPTIEAVIARAIHQKDRSDEATLRMVLAAERRYTRRKMAWEEAQQSPAGKTNPDFNLTD